MYIFFKFGATSEQMRGLFAAQGSRRDLTECVFPIIQCVSGGGALRGVGRFLRAWMAKHEPFTTLKNAFGDRREVN